MLTPWSSIFWQSFFLPAAPLTEANIGSLSGKVCLITGGNSGVGKELCQILYGAGATVYLAGRNAEACSAAIAAIKAVHSDPPSSSRLEFLKLDLSDLSTIKASAEDFLARSPDRLDFLCNNAGVMYPPREMKGAQGHELMLVTNCLGPFLFTEFLTPLLKKTARDERAKGVENAVRVAWAGSQGIDIASPEGGVVFEKGTDGLETQKAIDGNQDYGQSKTGNLFLAKAWGDKVKGDGIVSTCFNPGNLDTGLGRHLEKYVPAFVNRFIRRTLIHPAIYGAYTELYCGFSPDVTTADNGTYIAPWGRKWQVRPDIEESRTGELCLRYYDFVNREVAPFR